MQARISPTLLRQDTPHQPSIRCHYRQSMEDDESGVSDENPVLSEQEDLINYAAVARLPIDDNTRASFIADL